MHIFQLKCQQLFLTVKNMLISKKKYACTQPINGETSKYYLELQKDVISWKKNYCQVSNEALHQNIS